MKIHLYELDMLSQLETNNNDISSSRFKKLI